MADTVLRAHVAYATREPTPCTCDPDAVFVGQDDGTSKYSGDLHTFDCDITRLLIEAVQWLTVGLDRLADDKRELP